MSQLQTFLNSCAAAASVNLNLVHTANGEDFVKILESGAIIPSECTVFNQELLSYFFLGRPGYKNPLVHDPSYWQLPAVFVFDNLEKFVPLRAFPFDSGAFSLGRYRDILGRVRLEDFEISPNHKDIAKMIKTYFGNKSRYLDGRATPIDNIDEALGSSRTNYVPIALSKLYNFPFNDRIDDRARLLEIQYNIEIPLTATSLKAVICCREWMRDPYIRELIGKFKCDVGEFSLLPLNNSNYYSQIYEIARKIVG